MASFITRAINGGPPSRRAWRELERRMAEAARELGEDDETERMARSLREAFKRKGTTR